MPFFKFLTLTSAISSPFSDTAIHPSLPARQASGTGPHAPLTTFDTQLPGHIVYRPSNFSTLSTPAPVVVWGNAACNTTTGRDPYKNLNEELASWGTLVLACGDPEVALKVLENRRQVGGEDEGVSVDMAKVGMLGTSCGGADLYTAAEDARVLSLAVVDAEGVAGSRDTRALAANATKPVFFFSAAPPVVVEGKVGAGVQGIKADFKAVAKGVPAWYGALPGTDVQTLSEGSAGKLGRAARFWAQWMVEGDQRGKEFFIDASGAESEGWTVTRKGLDVLVS